MAQLFLNDDIKIMEDSDDEMLADPDEINNYKGMYQNDDEEETEEKYFEFGAHFPYQLLCEKLEEIIKTLSPERRGKLINVEVNNQQDITNSLGESFQGINKGIIIFIKEQTFRRMANDTKSIPIRNKANNNFIQYQGNLLQMSIKPQRSKNTNEKVLHDSDKQMSKQSSKPQSIHLINSSATSNTVLENNYLMAVALNNNILSNKSRNAINSDNVYKQTTGIQPITTTKIINQNVNNNMELVKNLNEIKIKQNIQKVECNMKNIGATIKKEEKKGGDGFNIYASYTNDLLNFNNNNKVQTSNKKSINKEIGGNLFKKSNPIMLIEKNSGSANSKNKLNHAGIPMNSGILGNYGSPAIGNSKVVPNKSILLKEKDKDSDNKKFKEINSNNSINNNPYLINPAKEVNNLTSLKNKNNVLQNNNILKSPNLAASLNSVMINYNLKYGRNPQPQLNPHNTNNATINLTKKFKNSSTNNTSAHQKLNYEIKKLNLENIKNLTNKTDPYKFITSSVDNREAIKKVNNIKNLNMDTRIINNKTNSLSPTKMIIDSNSNIIYLEKDNLKSFNSVQKQSEIKSNNSNSLTPNKAQDIQSTGLNDFISCLNLNNLNKNQENKSRNATRNNLTSTKSNIFQSDKAQSMQSGSFHKSNIFTQVAVKTSTNINNSQIVNKNFSKPRPITSINKTTVGAANAISIYKPHVANPNKSVEKTKTNLKITASKSNMVKKNTSVTINNKNNVNISQSIGSMMKKTIGNLAALNNTNNKNCTNVAQTTQISQATQISQLSQITPSVQSGKSTAQSHISQISQIKKNSLISNNNRVISEISPNNKVTSYNAKLDSSKQKTKSNSVTSNVSNVISTNNTSSKNPTKLTNVSFLNLKRNEFTVARNYTNTTSEKSSKALINTLSSGSLEQQMFRKPSKENSHLY